MRRVGWCVLTVVLLGSARCAPAGKAADVKAEILRLDAEWSRLASEGKDIDRVVSYWSDDAVVLPPSSPAVSGKQAIREFVSKSFQTPGFSISWKATDVTVAAAGDMAFAIETNRISLTGADGKPVVIPGKGVTVWRKLPDGSWKCALDIWNETPAPPQ